MQYDEIAAAGIGSMLLYLRPVVGVIIGLLADRTQGSFVILIAFIMMFLGSMFFASGIINPELNSLFFMGVTLSAVGIYALRALYFSIMQEGFIPVTLTGTAVGIISFIAYTPDIFSGPIIGYLLDSAPGGAGYRAIFSLLAVFSLLGLVATWAFRKSVSPTHQ
jgi:MFS family permease